MFASVRYLVSLLTISAFWLVYVTAPVQAYSHRLSPRTFYQMYNLASQGNKTALSNAIARGLNINAINDYGNTALCVAVKMRDVRAYNTLRSVGADPRPPCSHSIPNFDSFVNSPAVIKTATYIPRGYTNRSPRPSFNWGGTLLTAGIVATGVGVAFGMGGGGGGSGSGEDSSSSTEIPDTPTNPDNPDDPDQPGDNPDDPGNDPDTPSDPDNPDDPDQPGNNPDDPGNDPDNPSDPDNPDDPDQPGNNPDDPGNDPNNPSDPDNPDDPDDPDTDICEDNPCSEGCYENISCEYGCASYNECGGCTSCLDKCTSNPCAEGCYENIQCDSHGCAIQNECGGCIKCKSFTNDTSLEENLSYYYITNNSEGSIKGNVTAKDGNGTGMLKNYGTITGTIEADNVNNYTGASITGNVTVINGNGTGELDNTGLIDGEVIGDIIKNSSAITGKVTGSTITNNAGATIGNGVSGKDGTDTETLENSGSISGDVSIAQITNNTDATINGNITATGKITNQGTITGDTINGSDIENSASITGDVSGSIITNSAGSIDGNVTGTTVTNNASITGQVTGSNITNNSGATIGNGVTGKDGTSSETLDNSGAITGNVSISQITNNLGGSIDGNVTGTTVTNSASITGKVTGSTITNNAGATIGNGVSGKDGTDIETLENSGSISGDVSIAQITNNTDATINGNITATGKITNQGTITGDTINGSDIENSSAITGDVSGSIIKNNTGATIEGDVTAAGTLTNQGTITGNEISGTIIENSSTINGNVSGTIITNDTGATIEGDVTVTANSSGVLANSGTIKGTVSGDSITNNTGATIEGDVIASASGTGELNNSGSIEGDVYVTNIENSASIIGNVTGANITNNTGATINGDIVAVGEDGTGELKNLGQIYTDYLEIDKLDNQGTITAKGTKTFELTLHNSDNNAGTDISSIGFAQDQGIKITTDASRTISLVNRTFGNLADDVFGITFLKKEGAVNELSTLNIKNINLTNSHKGILINGSNLELNLSGENTLETSLGIQINAEGTVTFNNRGILNVVNPANNNNLVYGIHSTGNAIISNNDWINVTNYSSNADTYGIKIENGGSGYNAASGNIRVIGNGNAYGVYISGNNGYTTSFTNEGVIYVEAGLDNYTSYGMYASSTNSTTTTLTNASQIEVMGYNTVGMYGSGIGTTLINSGTITLSPISGNRENVIVCVDEASCPDQASPAAFSLRGGARMINQGTISAEEELDFDAMTQGEGTVYAARGSRFMANSIRGSLTAGADITIGSNQDQYTSTNAISAAQSNINLTSGSAMFTASLQQNGTDYDIVMNRSAFSDLLTNNSLANLLEHNYQSDNRIDFFDTLKTASTPKALNSALNKYTGSNFIPLIGWQNIQRINHISNTMSDLALSNQNLKEERIIAAADNYYINQDSTSSWSGYEDYINGINGLFDKAVTPQYRFGISFGFYNARTDFDTNESRRDSIVLASLPNRIDYDNWGALFMPYIGYSNSEYKRYVDSQKFEPNFDVWYQGINNKLFVKTHTLGMELKPTIEFNVHNIHQNKITEENNVSIASENILSMQTGVGFEINKDIDFGQSGKLGLHGGLMFYQELGSDVEDTYSAQIYGMDGRFNIPGYNQDDNRTELRLKADYQIENWNIYAEFDKSFATNDNTTYNIGVKLAF